MAEENIEYFISKITAAIKENDQQILNAEVTSKFFNDLNVKTKQEIKNEEKQIAGIDEELQTAQIQIEQLEIVKNSILANREIASESIEQLHLLECFYKRQIAIRENELRVISNEWQSLQDKAKKELENSTKYHELEKARVEYLLVDIELRKTQKQINDEKWKQQFHKTFQWQKFQNWCIQLATHCLLQREHEMSKQINQDKMTTIKKLSELQNSKRSNGIKEITPITSLFGLFGTQLAQSMKIQQEQPSTLKSNDLTVVEEKSQLSEVTQPKPIHKRKNLFEEDEKFSEMPILSPKIRVIADEVVVPASEPHHLFLSKCPEPLKKSAETEHFEPEFFKPPEPSPTEKVSILKKKWKGMLKKNDTARKTSSQLSQGGSEFDKSSQLSNSISASEDPSLIADNNKSQLYQESSVVNESRTAETSQPQPLGLQETVKIHQESIKSVRFQPTNEHQKQSSFGLFQNHNPFGFSMLDPSLLTKTLVSQSSLDLSLQSYENSVDITELESPNGTFEADDIEPSPYISDLTKPATSFFKF